MVGGGPHQNPNVMQNVNNKGFVSEGTAWQNHPSKEIKTKKKEWEIEEVK